MIMITQVISAVSITMLPLRHKRWCDRDDDDRFVASEYQT